ncbi:unnamed protein product [Arabidopsis thaliana]|uniref:RING-type E3 ubiquitin transferase n=1 Tax=Arabidopsis thaliana TaxID=3702 RepID=A0A5S9Y8F2_ARATH|nr:unnamed protein product [Arabidopsis thaliana]
MTFSKQFPLLLYFFFFFYFPLLNASKPKRCYSSSCGGNNLDVSFPFWLSPEQSSSCGYPGFNLHCETALKLPNSRPFLVQDIKSQRIHLRDPDNCLARRLLSFDASGSLFSPLHHVNYTFLSCHHENVKSSSLEPIHCLANSTPSDLTSSMPSSCQIFKTLLLPVYSPLAVDLNKQDLWLKWDSPDCTGCVDFSPLCSFINNTILKVKCFTYVDSGNPWLITLKILCLCLSVPFFIVITPAVCIIFIPIQQQAKSAPWRNDTLCPICLSEYTSEETVKSLPECEHCFHIECINPWLKLHNSCPVCRNSPSSLLTKAATTNAV